MDWKYCKEGNYWIASREMPNSNCDFIYCIYDFDGKYTVEAENNGYGAKRVAVVSEDSEKGDFFFDLEKLKKEKKKKNILWLYTGSCNCIGLITKEEL